MRFVMRLTVLGLLSLAALTAASTLAEAQTRRQASGEPLILNVRPRSFLDAGNVVQPGTLDRTTSGFAQTQSYLVSPPWGHMRDRFGEGTLPDPVSGPFIGARNPIGPIDYLATGSIR
jgi:hypothetical protein